MTYDLTPTQRLLEVLTQRALTKAERAIAREQIGRYYAKKLASLQQHLFEALEKRHTGELDPFELDEYIHPKRRRMPLPFEAWGGMRRSFVGGLGGIRRRHSFICSCIVDSQMKTMV
ncbi:hypothetical protein [Ktedonobacter racemifer]|uniref:Uncharacterized protein n=1 Tax=Ktedonobacter racemifer DSM 44963 TaxID=485913 RepID=D6TS54_KTERA|nr:hypothetical protein [Ktedonobacter racemifer]EFH86127.1 hypothetical protein Krac_7404 [Ktedonobacter racemifer DSM 44963]